MEEGWICLTLSTLQCLRYEPLLTCSTRYEEYFSRFQYIFRTEKPVRQFFIPGNHDTGYAHFPCCCISSLIVQSPSLQSQPAFSPHARTRYTSHFGSLNAQVSVSNHTLVFFDAPGFVQEDYERSGQRKSFSEWKSRTGGSFEFVKKLREGDSAIQLVSKDLYLTHKLESNPDPLVLFTHIPLYRPDGKSCGPLREKGTVRPGVGFGYQNTLGKHSTSFLLHQIRPIVVFR